MHSSFDIFNDIHIAWDNDRFIAMADHLSFVDVTCVLQWQGVKNAEGLTHRLLYFIWLTMHYVHVCGCVRCLFFH